MIAFLLVALFAAIAVASALTLADAAVRSRNAFRQLRGDLVRQEAVRLITVTVDGVDGARMPALRPAALSAGRMSPRRTLRAPGSLRAAA